MAKVNSVGISLPAEIISKIDAERGDIPRSRYILGVLRNTYSERNKLKEEGRSNSEDSTNREVGSFQSSESIVNPSELPMSQNSNLTRVNKNLCDGNGCSRKSTTEIEVKVGELGIIKLNLCEGCRPKFKQSINNENSKIVP
jgi:hypothetical protein